MKKIIFVILTIIILVFALTASVAATETADTGIQDEQTVTEGSGENSYLDSLIDKVTTSSFWVTVASFLTAIVSIIAVLKKHFGNISNLIRTKASAEELKTALGDAKTEIAAEYKNSLANIENQIKDEQDNIKKLSVILSIFISNAKINANARAEILQYITEIKDISGTVAEVVEKANKAIEEANAVEEKQPTPVLDEIVKETQTEISFD